MENPGVRNTRSSVNKRVEDRDDDNIDCGKCEMLVTNNHKAVACEACDLWFHIECEDIPETVYNYMKDVDTGSQINWYCSYCKRGCVKLCKRITKLEIGQHDIVQQYEHLEVLVKEVRDEMCQDQVRDRALENRVGMLEAREVETKEIIEKGIADSKEITGRLASIEAKMIEVTEKVEDGVLPLSGPANPSAGNLKPGAKRNSNIDYFFKEVCDIRERENSLVIYGAMKSTSQVVAERVEHDRNIVKSLMHICVAEHDNINFFVLRLGKATANSEETAG